MSEEIDRRILTICPSFIFQIPPQRTAAGHRAADWDVKNPKWTGEMHIVARNDNCVIKFINANGTKFAEAPVAHNSKKNPVEKVTDSSRYFTVKVSDGGGNSRLIGVGFKERSASFDFRTTIQDWNQRVAEEKRIRSLPAYSGPSKDYSLKKGETFTIAGLGGGNPRGKSRDASSNSSGSGLLAPPPPTGRRRRRGAKAATADPFGLSLDSAPPPAPAPAAETATADILSAFDSGTPATAPAASSSDGWDLF